MEGRAGEREEDDGLQRGVAKSSASENDASVAQVNIEQHLKQARP